MKFIGLVGTNSKRSTNRQLLQYIQKHFAGIRQKLNLLKSKTFLSLTNPPTNNCQKKCPQKSLKKSMRLMGLLLEHLSMTTQFQLFS